MPSCPPSLTSEKPAVASMKWGERRACVPALYRNQYINKVAPLTAECASLRRECTRGGFCNFMHLKPISRELRRELYGRRRKGYKPFLFLHSASKSNGFVTHLVNSFAVSTAAATGLGLDRERGGLAPGTEAGEAAATTRDVAPETENAPGDSEPQAMTTCLSLPLYQPPLPPPQVFLSLYPSRFTLGLIERYLIEAVTALMNLFFLYFWKWFQPPLNWTFVLKMSDSWVCLLTHQGPSPAWI